MRINILLDTVGLSALNKKGESEMRTEANQVAESLELPPRVSKFLTEMTGASMYEFALVASLVAVVGIIVLVALSIGA
jgi:hypothetical protein